MVSARSRENIPRIIAYGTEIVDHVNDEAICMAYECKTHSGSMEEYKYHLPPHKFVLYVS
jgi:hypothetical protein